MWNLPYTFWTIIKSKICKWVIHIGLVYCELETRLLRFKKQYSSSMPVSNEIIYYRDSTPVHSVKINDLANNPLVEYNCIVCKHDTSIRYFESYSELEAIKGKLEFVKCPLQIISAVLLNDSFSDNAIDIYPKNIGVEIVGNVLFSSTFIKHFFKIKVDEQYTVKIIDSNVCEYVLNNTETTKQMLSVTKNGFEILYKNG